MESFPSLLERTVASALLLLSTPPPSLSPPNSESKISGESEKRLALSNSKSCSSTVTNDDGSSAETRSHPLRMIAVVARCHEMKLKVVRRSRSKKFWRSDSRKLISGGKPAEFLSEHVSETTEASSCLSSSSSAVSSARTGGGWKEEAPLARSSKTKLPVVNSSSIMHRRAEAIKRLLSIGCTSEVRIRQLLGDSPDTSKALRMLLKQEEIKRSGAGGRNDPYLYTISSIVTS